MSRVISVFLCRPAFSGDIVPIARGNADFYDAQGPSNKFTVPTDVEIMKLVQSRVRTHFHNDGTIEMDGCNLFYLVVVETFCTMIYACVAEPGLTYTEAIIFLDEEIRPIMNSSQLQMVVEQANSYELMGHIEPIVLKLIRKHNLTKPTPEEERINALRAQVEDVRNVMADNVERIMERGEQLDNMTRRTEELQSSAASFKSTARRVQRHFCQENAKYTFCCVLTILILTTIIVLSVLYSNNVI